MAIDYGNIIANESSAKDMRIDIAAGIGQAQDTANNAVNTAIQAKSTADNANDRVNNIITNQVSGKDPEVTDGRHDNITNTTYLTLGVRMDANSESLADRSKKIYRKEVA